MCCTNSLLCSIYLAICFIAYFGVSTVVTMMVPYTELNVNAAVADVFKQRDVKVMGTLIAVGATAGLIGKYGQKILFLINFAHYLEKLPVRKIGKNLDNFNPCSIL